MSKNMKKLQYMRTYNNVPFCPTMRTSHITHVTYNILQITQSRFKNIEKRFRKPQSADNYQNVYKPVIIHYHNSFFLLYYVQANNYR